MKTCYIFGSLCVPTFNFKPTDRDLIIAADGGLKNTQKFNLTPDFIVGDFDSLKYTPTGKNVIKHPVKKDETDTVLAVNTALENGCDNFLIFGCLGGRLDQTLASVQTAAYITEKGFNAVFVGDEAYLTVIKNGEIRFSAENKGIISVFAYSQIAEGVSEENLLYSLQNATLTADYPLGVSNEFIGKDAVVSVENGLICVVWNGKDGNWSFGG